MKFERDARGTDIVVAYMHLYKEVYVDVDELEIMLGGVRLTQSSATCLVTTRDQLVDLV